MQKATSIAKSLSALTVYAVLISTNSFAIVILLQSLWIRVLWNRYYRCEVCRFAIDIPCELRVIPLDVSFCEFACLLVRVVSLQATEKPCTVVHTHRVKFFRRENYRYPCYVVTFESIECQPLCWRQKNRHKFVALFRRAQPYNFTHWLVCTRSQSCESFIHLDAWFYRYHFVCVFWSNHSTKHSASLLKIM